MPSLKRSGDQIEDGIVEKVSCSNFTCRTKLHVNVEANVKCITGRNGCGKCVVTGLSVGLEGNASNTHGNSLQFDEYESQVEEKKLVCQQCKSQLSSPDHHQQIDAAQRRNQEKKYKLQNDLRGARRRIECIRERIVTLQSSKKEALLKFGEYTEAILKAINITDQQKKFHKKPVGPLGTYIKVKDYKWAKAIEECIRGTTLCAYICCDDHDTLILKNIFKQKCGGCTPPSIIVSSNSDKLYDSVRNKFSPLTTVLDMLKIKNYLVLNVLIEERSVESVLLIENAQDAMKFMWNVCPRGTDRAMSIEGHQVIGGTSSKYYPCRNKDVHYLHRNVEKLLLDSERELLRIQNDEKEMKKKIEAIIDLEIKRLKEEMQEMIS